jgi:hypothetical protein
VMIPDMGVQLASSSQPCYFDIKTIGHTADYHRRADEAGIRMRGAGSSCETRLGVRARGTPAGREESWSVQSERISSALWEPVYRRLEA